MVKTTTVFGYMMVMATVMIPYTRGLEELITKFAINTNGLGTYSFEYETSGGTFRREEGGLLPNTEHGSLVVRGEYGYVDQRGQLYTIKYVADSNGYRPLLNADVTRYNDRRII